MSGSCITGYGSSPSRCGPAVSIRRSNPSPPVPVQRASAHARVFDHAEPDRRYKFHCCRERVVQQRSDPKNK
jgi:hypothetical protein